MNTYYVYIMANPVRHIYVGVTNDLRRRVWEHKQGCVPGFTARFGITRLVYFESTNDVRSAIAREKQIKGWIRTKKEALIEVSNPEWHDLSLEWDGDQT